MNGLPDATQRALNKTRTEVIPSSENNNPEFALPNLSGDLSRGRVLLTPTEDTHPANKAYVDAHAGGGGGTPGGSDTQIQFNDSSAFGGDSGLTYNKTTDTLSVLGNVELGHATDTTISRVSAGVVAIEGSNIIKASDKLSALSATTSAELAGVISNETGSGLLVFNDTPTLTTPVLSGTPNAAGETGRDSTQLAPNYYDNGQLGTIPKVINVGVGTETLVNSTASDQDYTSIYTLPANSLFTNKVYRITLSFEVISGTSSVTITQYLKIGATKTCTSVATNVTDGLTRGYVLEFLLFGRAAAGASANTTTSVVSVNNFNSNTGNTVNQPVALATNGILAITPGITFSGTGSTESVELQGWLVEELN